MKKTILNLSIISCSFAILTSCGNGEKSADRTEEIYEKHVSHDDMEQQEHEEMTETEEAPTLSQTSPELQQQVNTLVSNYLDLKNALVESSAESSRAAASQLLANVKAFDSSQLPEEQKDFYENHVEAMSDDLGFMAENNELDKQRDHFTVVTKNTYALAKAVDSEQSLYYQYCPMAFDNNGGYWLSAQEEIRNPYFGDKMLKCGRVEETIN